jgi:hypothetical protein
MVSENLVLVRDYLAVKGAPNPGPRQLQIYLSKV